MERTIIKKVKIKKLKNGEKKLTIKCSTTNKNVKIGSRFVVEYDDKKWPFSVTEIEAKDLNTLTLRLEEVGDVFEEKLVDKENLSLCYLRYAIIY